MEIAAARRPITIQLRLISMCLLLLIRLLVLAILNGCWVRVQETLAWNSTTGRTTFGIFSQNANHTDHATSLSLARPNKHNLPSLSCTRQDFFLIFTTINWQLHWLYCGEGMHRTGGCLGPRIERHGTENDTKYKQFTCIFTFSFVYTVVIDSIWWTVDWETYPVSATQLIFNNTAAKKNLRRRQNICSLGFHCKLEVMEKSVIVSRQLIIQWTLNNCEVINTHWSIDDITISLEFRN